jgi:putative membrane protein
MQTRNVAIVAVAVVVVLLALVAALGVYGPGMMGYGMYGYRAFPLWGGLAMMFFMLLFWLAIIAAIAWLGAWLFRQGRLAPPGPEAARPTALDILSERYARGEISREQYEQMRRDIEGGQPPLLP